MKPAKHSSEKITVQNLKNRRTSQKDISTLLLDPNFEFRIQFPDKPSEINEEYFMCILHNHEAYVRFRGSQEYKRGTIQAYLTVSNEGSISD